MSDERKFIKGYWFVWDNEKAKKNFRKHGVTFELAAEVFFDKNAVRIYDELHSDDEDRYQIIGTTEGYLSVLFVIYVERTSEDDAYVYRIISARDANRKEMEEYGMGLSEISAYQTGSPPGRNVHKRRRY